MANIEELKNQLFDLHKAGLRAHLEKDIPYFTTNIGDQVMSISNGEIRYASPEQINMMFTNYLNSTEFSIYEDVQDPIVSISDDGSMSWLVANVRVARVRTIEDEQIKFDNTWAWVMFYRRKNNQCIREGNISTMKEN